jgi:hypothetical protein
VPEASKKLWPNVIAGIGYALTFFSCIFGTAVVLVGVAIVILVDLARGLGTGTFRERLRKPRW